MHKVNSRVVLEIDRLIDQYIELIEESSRLRKENPKKSLSTLVRASLIEIKIEELKIAKNN